MPFSQLGLSPSLLQAVQALGYPAPTWIQTATIPPALNGQDILATAQTGSGKTLAFVLPLIQTVKPGGRPRNAQALILVPTRELALQIGQTLQALVQRITPSIKVNIVFGGVSINPQMMALRGGTDVIVATPGRLLDLLDRHAVGLAGIRTLVLDEADRMLDLGFSEELARILAVLPRQRQSLFFSATLPSAVHVLANTLLNAPVRVDAMTEAQRPPDITQRAIVVDPGRRTQLLRHLIQTQEWKRVLVFVATKHAAEMVADKLRKAHIHAEPFHGMLSQGKRMQVLQDFKASRITAVVATDVAARGLDISQLPVVVNFDLPRSPLDYTHRIGRTGRAGAIGLAISMVNAATEAHFQLIERRQRFTVPREQVMGFEPQALEASPPPSSGGGVKGKRPSKKDKLRAAAQQG